MIFAIVDMSPVVDIRHLDAALEVWRYSRETVAYVFGTSTGNKVADRILGELRGTEGDLDRTGIHKLFDKHVAADVITEALSLLTKMGLAIGIRTKTAGRPRESWRLVNQPHADSCEDAKEASKANQANKGRGASCA